MKLGLQIERAYQEQGKYPGSLEELASKFPEGLPKDPFSGDAYHYTPSKDGFLLYSIGPNWVDDGGQSDGIFKDLGWRKPISPPQDSSDS